ncbi:MAG: hypothetical protein ACFBSC_14475 [Microcoleaceae cyanobacterium]
MTSTVAAKDINLRDLIDQFKIELVQDRSFFPEWQQNLPELTDTERQLLDQVKAGYLNLLQYPPLTEDVVRMAVVDPILFIGSFFLHPYNIRSEEPISLNIPDEEVTIRGRIDTLSLFA